MAVISIDYYGEEGTASFVTDAMPWRPALSQPGLHFYMILPVKCNAKTVSKAFSVCP